MHWFRLKIRPCARLALFALALQMAVSFGHMHRDDLGLPPLPASDQTQAVADAGGAQPRSDQHNNQKPDDYCPICASMALIATAMPSLPPLLIVPAPIAPVWLPEIPVQRLPTRVALSFQARAPPAI
jgi:hypothetical protein